MHNHHDVSLWCAPSTSSSSTVLFLNLRPKMSAQKLYQTAGNWPMAFAKKTPTAAICLCASHGLYWSTCFLFLQQRMSCINVHMHAAPKAKDNKVFTHFAHDLLHIQRQRQLRLIPIAENNFYSWEAHEKCACIYAKHLNLLVYEEHACSEASNT